MLAVLSGLVWGSLRSSSAALKAVLICLASALAVLMALHLAPGFANPKVFDNVRFSADAAPFTQYLNFDKGAAGLIFLAAYAPRVQTFLEAGRVGRVALLTSVGTSIVVIAAALAVGYVRSDLKVPVGTSAFLATNLFFSCVAEEAFFHGLLQERLARALPASRLQFWLPLVISSILYGAAHAAGGADFAVLATSLAATLLTPMAGAQMEPLEPSDNSNPYPVVLTPTRLRQALQDVPASVTIITSDTISRFGIMNIPDALRLVPGMEITQPSGNDYRINYHGTNILTPRRMNVLVDGVSVYEPAFARVDWRNLPVAIDDVARIEVTRGPDSAAYGPNSMLAIINIITKHPDDVERVMLSTTDGSNGTHVATARLAAVVGPTSLRLTANTDHDEGYDAVSRTGPAHDGTALNRLNLRSQTVLDVVTNLDI